MSRFIVIKKKTILLFLLLILTTSFLVFSFYYINTKKNIIKSTFSQQTLSEDISLDFTGDGEKDTLEVTTEKNTYIVKIKSASTEYILQPNDNSKFLGEYTPNAPLRITTLDLSRDGIPEIIIRTFKDTKPINYIFTWKNNNFTNIYTSSNNILGILDSKNSRSPKILSALSSEGNSSTESYIFNGKSFKDITFSNTTIPSLNLIQSFIDFVESPYELSDAPDIFTSTIDSNELGILWTLDKDVHSYSFQNAYFYDTNWDYSNNINTINWCLSFEKVNKLDSSIEKKELLIFLVIEKDSYNNFKISSIRKQ